MHPIFGHPIMAAKVSKAFAKTLMNDLNKTYGDGTYRPIEKAGSNIKMRVQTGLDIVDLLTGGGFAAPGLPTGRLIELYGKEQLGKSSLACMILASAQAHVEAFGVIIDTESTLTVERAVQLGVNTDHLLYCEETYIEDIVAQIQTITAKLNSRPGVLVWDTVAMTKTKKNMGRKIGEDLPAAMARAASSGLREIAKDVSHSNLLVIACNQMKLGNIGNPFATNREKEGTAGGGAFKFGAEQRISLSFVKDLSREMQIDGKKKRVPIGYEVQVKVTKNKSGVINTVGRLVMETRNVGTFSNALSTLHTLRGWGVISKTAAKISIAGRSIDGDDAWVSLYDNDAAFRTQVKCLMEAAYLELYCPAEDPESTPEEDPAKPEGGE